MAATSESIYAQTVSSRSELADALMAIPLENWQRRRHYDDIVHGLTWAETNRDWINALIEIEDSRGRMPRAWRYTSPMTRLIRVGSEEYQITITGPLLEEMRRAAIDLTRRERARANILQARRTGADGRRTRSYSVR